MSDPLEGPPSTPPPPTPPAASAGDKLAADAARLADDAAKVAGTALSDPKTLGHICYGLFAGGFITGFSVIVGLILCYIKQDEMKATFVASHLTWLIRTFWLSLVGSVAGVILSVTIVGAILGVPLLLATAVWAIYRLVRGWIGLSEGKPIPDPQAWI